MTYTFGEKIRILRTIKGLSQRGLALKSGLRQENISYIENNKSKKKIPEEMLLRIAKGLNMDIAEVMDFNPEQGAMVKSTVNEPAANYVTNLKTPIQKKEGELSIIELQTETIEILQKLITAYKGKLKEI